MQDSVPGYRAAINIKCVVWDLDNEAAETAAELGLGFVRAATAGTYPAFVASLRELLEEREQRDLGLRHRVGQIRLAGERASIPRATFRDWHSLMPSANSRRSGRQSGRRRGRLCCARTG